MCILKRYVLTFLFFVSSLHCTQAQDDTISTERPTETQSPHLVPRGYLQTETGFHKEATGKDFILFHPRTTLRYSISKKVELRAELHSVSEKRYSEQEQYFGLRPLQIGVKTPLLKENGWMPKTSLMTMIGIPTLAAEALKARHLFPLIRLLMENRLTEKLELDYNIGAEWDGTGKRPQWIVTIEPQMSIAPRWQVFVEAYSRWQQGEEAEHVVDAGLGFFISPNLKLDVVAGSGLSQQAPDYFIGTGISFRFH